MELIRTPEARFEHLPDFAYEPQYVDVTAPDCPPIRMHYVDAGDPAGSPVVLLHGEPTWSYLYHSMIPPLADAGHRVLAPDLVGFGRSDKPTKISDHSYARHVAWVRSWWEQLDLTDVTLVIQDWGSLIGLRLAGEMGDRIGRIFVANGFLPTATTAVPLAFRAWRTFARWTPIFDCGFLVQRATVDQVPAGQVEAYNAPFPNSSFQAGPRAMPQLVPTTETNPATAANRAAWAELGRWQKPFLCVFGKNDPILGAADQPLIEHVPGAAGQPHARIRGGHFIQQDAGPELAKHLLAWKA
ncbi:MAG: haloalkane dehalogenase [Aeromicrobium sp.]